MSGSFPLNMMYQTMNWTCLNDYHKDIDTFYDKVIGERTADKGGEVDMAIEYLGLKRNQRPSGCPGRRDRTLPMRKSWNFTWMDGTRKIGRIIEIYEDKAVIQVFEGTDSMSLKQHPHQTDRTSYGDRAFP